MTSETKNLPARFAPRIDGGFGCPLATAAHPRIDFEPHINAWVKAHRRKQNSIILAMLDEVRSRWFSERLRTAWLASWMPRVADRRGCGSAPEAPKRELIP